MMLHLKASKGGGWSDTDTERETKQAIIIPITIDSMMHNLNNYACISLIFFGELSLPTIGIQSWRSHISSNLLVYKSLCVSDCEFISQVLTTINTRVNCWIDECTSKPYRCNVDDELLNFDDMKRMIKKRNFYFSLPPAVRCHTSKQPRANHHDHDKSRYDWPSKRSPVHNKNWVSPWKLKENEYYKAIFNNENSSKLPTLDGVHLYPRCHTRGIYFTGCNLSSTHCVITDDTLKQKMT